MISYFRGMSGKSEDPLPGSLVLQDKNVINEAIRLEYKIRFISLNWPEKQKAVKSKKKPPISLFLSNLSYASHSHIVTIPA